MTAPHDRTRPSIAPPSAAPVGRTLKHDRSVDSQHSRR